MTSAKDETALKALNVALVYVDKLAETSDKGLNAHIDAAAQARDALATSGLSSEVSRAVWNLNDKIAKLTQSSWDSLASSRAVLARRVLRRLAEAFVVGLYLLVGVVSYWNVALIALCLVVSIVERILLGDAFALKTIARIAKAVARLGSRF